MLALAQNGYTEQQVRDMLHGKSGSRDVRFRFALLNALDVELGDILSVVPGGSVSVNALAEISRIAQFSISESDARDIDWLSDRIKPYMRIKMADGGFTEWPLGVFLLSSPTRRSGSCVVRPVEAYDKSLILKEDQFTERYRIAATTTYTDAVKTILESAGLWKINLTTSTAALSTDKEFEIGTSKLEAINTLLTEINYAPVYIDANGYAVAVPYVIPTLRETDYTYATDEVSIILPGAIQEDDLFAVPNKWVVVASNPEKAALVSTFTNDRATSPTSTTNRKRAIVDYRQIDDIFDQSTLDGYVQRLAYEASQIYGKCIFETAPMPHHGVSDMLFISHSELEVDAKYTEMSWTLDLSASGKMKHECRRVIRI